MTSVLEQQRLAAMTDEEMYLLGLRMILTNRLRYYKPNPKQFDFHAAGKQYRERLFCAGNQLGKSHAGAAELAIHLTGRYPDWWQGARFYKPITAWTGSESNESSREIIQKALLGTEVLDRQHPDFGTGAIPGDAIAGVMSRYAGVKDVADQIVVRHVSGGYSRVHLKVYEQGWEKFQGVRVDYVWLDEEPPHFRIYTECLTRTQAAEQGRLCLTFTPLRGETEIVQHFKESEASDQPSQRTMVTMTIHDCTGGTWPSDTPFAGRVWKGLYTKARVAEIIAGWPKHERRTRALGIPMSGEGMVWPFEQEEFTCEPFPIPRHFPQIGGMDFGIADKHPFAFAVIAWDRDQDIVYVTHTYRLRNQGPGQHCDLMRPIAGDWMPIAWPHDGDNHEKSSTERLIKSYRDRMVANIQPFSARYPRKPGEDHEKGGKQPVEPIILDVGERLQQGRFKVFSGCVDWLEEHRGFHRKDGKVVAIRDDAIKASLYALMELRHARCKPDLRPVRVSQPILRQWG